MLKRMVALASLAALAMATAWANAAADYSLRINNPAVVAGTELKAGDYRLELAGDKVVIHGKKYTVEAPVKMEEGTQKYSGTTVTYSVRPDGKYRISEIHLGGTKMKVVFND
jgi:hypothetical protein